MLGHWSNFTRMSSWQQVPFIQQLSFIQVSMQTKLRLPKWKFKPHHQAMATEFYIYT